MATTTSDRSEMTVLDGSIMEGGGQILRNSFALAAILHRPINVTKIRAGRDNPGTRFVLAPGAMLLIWRVLRWLRGAIGLRNQHLSGIVLISQLAPGPLKGDSVCAHDHARPSCK